MKNNIDGLVQERRNSIAYVDMFLLLYGSLIYRDMTHGTVSI